MDVSLRTLLCAALVAACSVRGALSSCGAILPGLDKMVRGVDLTSLDLVPQEISSGGGFKAKLLKTVCYKNKTKEVDGTTYSVPDMVWHTNMIPSGSLSSSRTVLRNSKEVRDSLSVSAGVEGNFKKFAFSVSTSYSRSQSKLSKNERTVQSLSAQFNSRQVDFEPAHILQLDDNARDMLMALPYQFNQASRTEYEKFIKKFGTHYISIAKFGGLLNMYMETDMSYVETETTNSVEVNAEATFASVLTVKTGVATSHSEADSSFTSNTHSRMNYFGGTANLVKEGGVAEWQPTIAKMPWLFSAEVKPISDLIPYANRKSAMKKALEDFVMRTYLTQELPRILNLLPNTVRGDYRVTEVEDRINRMKNQEFLNAAELEQLGRDVENCYFARMVDYSVSNPQTISNQKVSGFLDNRVICPTSKVISWVSVEGGYFSVRCSYVKGFKQLSCRKSNQINGHLDGTKVEFTCNPNEALKNIEWGNKHFQFTCCSVIGYPPLTTNGARWGSAIFWSSGIRTNTGSDITPPSHVVTGLKRNRNNMHWFVRIANTY